MHLDSATPYLKWNFIKADFRQVRTSRQVTCLIFNVANFVYRIWRLRTHTRVKTRERNRTQSDSPLHQMTKPLLWTISRTRSQLESQIQTEEIIQQIQHWKWCVVRIVNLAVSLSISQGDITAFSPMLQVSSSIIHSWSISFKVFWNGSKSTDCQDVIWFWNNQVSFIQALIIWSWLYCGDVIYSRQQSNGQMWFPSLWAMTISIMHDTF